MRFVDKKYHQNRDHKSCPPDEYYTKYEEVKYIFEELLIKEDLKDKIIYCPADGEKSNFVIYLKEHKDDIKYKELIYTSDDMFTHEDLFQKADYIITNPPFSLLTKKILPFLKKNNYKFFLFGSMINNFLYTKYYKPNELKYIRRIIRINFETPFISDITGEKECYVNGILYMTNMNINENNKEAKPYEKFLTKSLKDIPNVYDENNYLVIDKMHDFPNDYYEPVLVTNSCYQYKYTKYFDYFDYCIRRRHKYTDNKRRFIRCLVQRKKENYKENDK